MPGVRQGHLPGRQERHRVPAVPEGNVLGSAGGEPQRLHTLRVMTKLANREECFCRVGYYHDTRAEGRAGGLMRDRASARQSERNYTKCDARPASATDREKLPNVM
eukprot:1194465-Prorocentrum_minimum.AAC.5